MSSINSPAYNYDAPTREFAITLLIKSLGRAQAMSIWNEACRRAEVNHQTTNIEELERVFDQISQEPGAAGVLGKSLQVRISTYKTLNDKVYA